MKIVLHGGDCCGIKHIINLGNWPDNKLAARKAVPSGEDGTSFGHGFSKATNDMRSKYPDNSDEDFFNEAAASHKYSTRLRKFVTFLRRERPHGLIEITLNQNQSAWNATLEKLGFKAVSTFKNSNTGSLVTVWHLAY